MKIDLAELEMAFIDGSGETTWYLDTESGEVFMITQEVSSYLEEALEEIGDQKGDIEELVAAALAQSNIADWEKELVVQAARAEAKFGAGVIIVPNDDSSDGFRDMEDYVESVANVQVRNRLDSALRGSRPFRRFKDVIAAYPKEEERWFAFRDERLRERIVEWLEDEGIEPVF